MSKRAGLASGYDPNMINKLNKEIEEELDPKIKKMLECDEIDSEHRARVYYSKLANEEMISCIFNCLSAFSAIFWHTIQYKIQFNDDSEPSFSEHSTSQSVLLVMTSIFSFLFICSTVLRYFYMLNIEILMGRLVPDENFFKTDLAREMTLEIVIALIHPNIFSDDAMITFSDDFYSLDAKYKLNDLLMIPCQLRLYSLIRLLVFRTHFYGDKISRVCKMMGIKLTLFFSIKCLIKKEPMKMWLSLLLVSVLILAAMLKVLENGQNDFNTFGNCVWNVLITMTTVGYGDMFPLTNFGRVVAIITALIGTLFISMVSVTLSDMIELNQNEGKCYDLYGRMLNKKKLKDYSAKIFILSFNNLNLKNQIKKLKTNGDKGNSKEIESLEKQLKEVVYKRWVIKKDFRLLLHNFRSIYEEITEFEPVNNRLNFIGKKLKEIEFKTNELSISLKKIDKKLRENMAKVKVDKPAEAFDESTVSTCVWNSRIIDED